MKKTNGLSLIATRLPSMLSMVVLLIVGTACGPSAGTVVQGNLGDVRLITGDVLELEFSSAVLNDADAQATFDILIDGKDVEWEYLSYFAFGEYADKPVVNVRLKNALDIGQIRARCRENDANAEYDRTEDTIGPLAASKITVKAGGTTKVPTWHSFYLERSQGYMSRFWTYASRKAGNGDDMSVLGDKLENFGRAKYDFTDAEQPKYTDEYVARMVGEGTNKLLGRAEYLCLPMIYAGYTAFIVGPTQSVYEAPEYRELYQHGETTDTFTRRTIKATEVPGNFNPETGQYVKPYIVGTSDDIMRHDAPIKADGTPAGNSEESARPRSDHFYFGEAFFDIAYELAVVQGSRKYPLTALNKSDDYRFDIHLQEAYDKANKAGMWPGTKMMESVKDYYVYGAMAFQEFIPETQRFESESFPVNTRMEVYDYDYPLYWALSGIHGKWCYWAGKGAGQTSSGSTDDSKVNTPWWWRNQPDNFGLPETSDGAKGAAYEPLKIEKAEVVSKNEVHVYFNREISTISAVMQNSGSETAVTSANFKIYLDGEEVPFTSVVTERGYLWKGIRLAAAERFRGANNRWSYRNHTDLDNGNPYGLAFQGFTRKDIDERKIDNGGWIANDQPVGEHALEMGTYVGLEDAVRDYGAGLAGKVEVAYVGGGDDVLDWDGNELAEGKVEAVFKPWIGHVYRSALTGVYVYLESAVAEKPYYMYTRAGEEQPTAKDVAMAAGHQYETLLTNNSRKTYPASSGGADFDKAFAAGSGDNPSFIHTQGNSNRATAYSWDNGTVTVRGQNLTNGPVTYDNPGQRIADGFTQQGGGMKIAAGSVMGHHNGRQPDSSSMGGDDVGEILRIEGWGGRRFQSEDVGVLRDYNLSRYRNESLVFHEGGHGVDSALPVYAQNIYNDVTAAYVTAIAPVNGLRYHSVDGVAVYIGKRGEYIATGNTFFHGTMREQFEGKIDPTWTPISNRYEWNRYDPYGVEAFKRMYYNGDLNLWYGGKAKIGDPAYRVILEDWKLLRDLGQTDPDYAFAKDWDDENDLLAWGLGVPVIARENPYTGGENPLVKWVSYNSPCIWDIEPYKKPTRTDWRKDIKFDFDGEHPYYPGPVSDEFPNGEQSFVSLIHPFLTEKGVPMPKRPAEIAALVAPVSTRIAAGSLRMVSKVILEFELEDIHGEINMNNAMTTFRLTVDGAKTHFYFWKFDMQSDGRAKVQLRLEWPVEDPTLELTVIKTGQTVASSRR